MRNRIFGTELSFPRLLIEPSEPASPVRIPPEMGVEAAVLPRLNRRADSEYDVGYVGGAGCGIDVRFGDGGSGPVREDEPAGPRSESRVEGD